QITGDNSRITGQPPASTSKLGSGSENCNPPAEHKWQPTNCRSFTVCKVENWAKVEVTCAWIGEPPILTYSLRSSMGRST
ncbi:hypothetical protein HAX54_008738, partial [Datura stramonium]|nr:hypothetical protein [Datura stramonium]